MEKLEKYGHYYKRRKGQGYRNSIQKITVISVDEEANSVTFVWGHYSKNDIKHNHYVHLKRLHCKQEAVITHISSVVKRKLDMSDREFEKLVDAWDRAKYPECYWLQNDFIEVLVLVVIHNTRTLVYTEFVYYENK